MESLRLGTTGSDSLGKLWKIKAIRAKLLLESQARTGFMGSKQLGFGDYEQATAKRRTRRERFLDEMEKLVPA